MTTAPRLVYRGAPLDAPRYAVAVMLERGGEGSHAGAELAGQVLAAAFATE